MAYSSRQQEQYFRPFRLQILETPQYRYDLNTHGPDYLLVVRDLTQRGEVSVVAEFYWKGREDRPEELERHWTDQRPKGQNEKWRWNFGTKKYAIAIAREEARTRGLPFQEDRDLVLKEEVREGPIRICAMCGETKGPRGWDPWVCQECRAAWTAGKQELAESKLYGVMAADLFKPGHNYKLREHAYLSEAWAREVLAVAGLTLGKTASRYGHDYAGFLDPNHAGYGDRWIYPVRMTESQLEHLKALVDLQRDLLDHVEDLGQKHGESLLRGLADGDLTVNELNERSLGLGVKAVQFRIEPEVLEEMEGREGSDGK